MNGSPSLCNSIFARLSGSSSRFPQLRPFALDRAQLAQRTHLLHTSRRPANFFPNHPLLCQRRLKRLRHSLLTPLLQLIQLVFFQRLRLLLFRKILRKPLRTVD